MPEAFYEMEELFNAVSKHHPEWLRKRPDDRIFKMLLKDWTRRTGGFWDRVRLNTQNEISLIASRDALNAMDRARTNIKERREIMMGMESFERVALTDVKASLTFPVADWYESVFEPWRFDGWRLIGNGINDDEHPYHQWIGGFLDPFLLKYKKRGWAEFWARELEPRDMPAAWMRWAFEHLQQFRAVSDGAPSDCQLYTYLLKTDYFLSSDKVFIRIASKISPSLPMPAGVPTQIFGGTRGVEQLLYEALPAIAEMELPCSGHVSVTERGK